MTGPELLVKGKVILDDRIQSICIGIDEGRITVLGNELKAEKNLDYSKYLILPGGVDIHTHMRDPGFTHKEDFGTGTKSALFGGTTTVLDMPNTQPPVDTPNVLDEKLDEVAGKANADFGMYARLTPDSDITALRKKAIGFKLFTADTTAAHPISFSEIEKLLAEPELEGMVVAVHAEDPQLFQNIEPRNLHEHDVSRPRRSEVQALERIICMPTKAVLHMAHMTCLESLDTAMEYSTEATPHHLFLNSSYHTGARGKVNPPLRDIKTQASLFSAFVRGRVGIVASDHAPHTIAEKEAEFENAPSGIPGVETRLPLLMAMAHSEQVNLGLVQATCCENPGILFGLNKGKIEVGYDADLAIFDINEITRIKSENLHSKCGWTPYESFNAIFPKHVILRGELVIDDRELVAEGRGRPL